MKHVVIIAGEESGDLHAADLVKELRNLYPDIKLSGIGGKHLQKAGLEVLFNLAQYGVTGLTEILRYLPVIWTASKIIKKHLLETKPDLLILVDYPGFNLRLAQYAKKNLKIKIIYYISPQIWAWKENRIKTIKACVDHMAVIFPFEKEYYQKASMPVSFVGHPLIKNLQYEINLEETRHRLGLMESKKYLALLPGSRIHEIQRHLPVLIETAQRLLKDFKDLHFIIPVAKTIDKIWIKSFFDPASLPILLTDGEAVTVMQLSDYVIVASGTASLECALIKKPMCIIYKASWFTYLIAWRLIKVKYLGLCNILKKQMIVPELLQYDCNAIELSKLMAKLMGDQEIAESMISKLEDLKNELSPHNSDLSLIELIKLELNIQ